MIRQYVSPLSGSKHDTAPGTVDREVRIRSSRLCCGFSSSSAWVSVLGELGDRRIDGALRVLVQLRVFRQEAFRDRQAHHWLCPPLASYPRSWPPREDMLDRSAPRRWRKKDIPAK